MEPFEHLVIDTPDEFSGAIIEKLGKRKAVMTNMVPKQALIKKLLADIIHTISMVLKQVRIRKHLRGITPMTNKALRRAR